MARGATLCPANNQTKSRVGRRAHFIGGSDARIIMGNDEAALVRLWREKRGEAEPEDLSGNLIVQLGSCHRGAQPAWYERNTGRRVTDVQRRVKHLGHPLDGGDPGRHRRGDRGGVRGQVHAAVVVLRGGGGRKVHGPASAQHVGHPPETAVLSIITGGGKWVEIAIPLDPLYLSVLVRPRRSSGAASQSGEPPHLINAEPPRPRIEAIRIVDMSSLEFLGGVRRPVPQHPGGLSRPRAGQERAQGA